MKVKKLLSITTIGLTIALCTSVGVFAANNILSDEQKKAQYDQFGHAGVDPSMGGGHGGFGGFSGFGDVFEDIFENIFSGGRGAGRQSRGQRGADLQFNAQLTLEEAALGKEIEITVPRHGSFLSIPGIC